MSGPGSWIESTFCKRECIKFVPSSKDNARCCCGQLWQYHRDGSPATLRGPSGDEPHWSPSRHTHLLPTDAFGTLEFQGGAVPTKAQYIRLSHDTRPDLIIDLLTKEWNLDLPKLLITVQGGKTNFELQPKLKKVIRKGLYKAAKTTGAWVFTAGTNTGVTRHVGEALVSETSVRIRGGGRMVSVGIAPWGVVERRGDLIGRNNDVHYNPLCAPRSRFAALNSHHTYFLLVDNGTAGKYGAELILRRKLENYISKQRIQTRGGLATPVVCVVIEGGPQTIRQILEYVTDSPPVPVIVCDGTGRAADIIAFVYKCEEEGRLAKGNPEMYDHVRSIIVQTLEEEFDLRTAHAQKLFEEVHSCVKKRELITVFRLKEDSELDQSILSALLHAHYLSDPERLSLALTWNRVDIARTHVFNDEVEWQQGSLELAMMDALVHDRIEFVKLLLEQGVIMTKFLTMQRLEDLYNAKQGPPNTMRYIIRDVKKNVPRDYKYSLTDIGLVINKLMGGAFRSTYTRRKFRNYYTIMKMNTVPNRRMGSIFQQHQDFSSGARQMSLQHTMGGTPFYSSQLVSQSQQTPAPHLLGVNKAKTISPKSGVLPLLHGDKDHQGNDGSQLAGKCDFEYPFSELLVWAVLTKRQGLAMLMWRHGEEALAKSLVAAKLYKALASEAADDDLETEVHEELRRYAKEFETLAVELLTYCYQQDEYRAHQLLTYELKNWSKQTCLALAVAVNHRTFIAQPCCQILLADLWLGGLRTRKNTNLKVLLGLFFPPVITCLGFRSREELRTMPQTREERYDVDVGTGATATGDSETGSDTDDEMKGDQQQEEGKKTPRSASPLPYTTTTIKVPLISQATELPANPTETTKPSPPVTQPPTTSTTTTLVPPLPPVILHHNHHSQKAPPSAVFPFIDPNTDPETIFNSGLENGFHPNGSSTDRVMRKSTIHRRDAVVTKNSSVLADQSAFLEKKSKELSSRTKFYEFFNAPITKFWSHSFAYLVFLCMFTYVVLVKLPDSPHWTEYYTISYVVTLMVEKARQIIAREPHKLKQKLEVWSENRWNVTDVLFGTIFLIALGLRLQTEPYKSYGRVTYCTIIMYWYLKTLEILSSHKYLGPLVMMMGKMIKNMAYFVVLLLVVLMAFGVCRQSILFPDEEPAWRLARHIFYQPYFMLYGEVFAGDIDPPCGGEGEIPCHPGRWITPTAMSMYLLVANILLINLLIAVFNNIFTSINAMSQQVWKFQRFQVVMEFEERPVFPPPLIIMAHIHRTFKYIRRRFSRKQSLHDKGLKLFLDQESLERVHDFEEECVYGYLRDKEQQEQMTTEERVRTMADRSEGVSQRLEDINNKLVTAMKSLQNSDMRLKRVEDSYNNLQRVMITYFDHQVHSSDSYSSSTGSSDSASSHSNPPDSPHLERYLKKNLRRPRRRHRKRGSSDRDALKEVSDEETDSVVKETTRRRSPHSPKTYESSLEMKRKMLSSDTSTSKDDDSKALPKSNLAERSNSRKSSVQGKVMCDNKVFRKKSIEEENASQEAREKRRRSSGGSKHSSESGSFSRSAKERKLSGNHFRKSSFRRKSSSRGSGKGSFSEALSPSRVTFAGQFDEDGTSSVAQEERLTLPQGMVQRSVSQPSEQNGEIVGALRYERSYSTSGSNRPKIRVIPPSSPPIPLIKINTEYTSLADELENVVMARLSPPSTPQIRLGRIRHHSESATLSTCSNPLRDAEETDFLIMEGLIQRRLYRNSENLAISLEELCSITSETSDHDISVLFQSQVPPSTVTDPVFIEKSPTLQEFFSKSVNNSDIPTIGGQLDDKNEIIPGPLAEVKKRHSISLVDSTKLGEKLSPDSQATEDRDTKSIEKEDHNLNIDNTVSNNRDRLIPQNLNLLSSSGMSNPTNSLLPPQRVLASPVHSLLIMDQTIVPLTLGASGDACSDSSTLYPIQVSLPPSREVSVAPSREVSLAPSREVSFGPPAQVSLVPPGNVTLAPPGKLSFAPHGQTTLTIPAKPLASPVVQRVHLGVNLIPPDETPYNNGNKTSPKPKIKRQVSLDPTTSQYTTVIPSANTSSETNEPYDEASKILKKPSSSINFPAFSPSSSTLYRRRKNNSNLTPQTKSAISLAKSLETLVFTMPVQPSVKKDVSSNVLEQSTERSLYRVPSSPSSLRVHKRQYSACSITIPDREESLRRSSPQSDAEDRSKSLERGPIDAANKSDKSSKRNVITETQC